MSALFDLTGRTALVTGSSRGIGNALARALADAGATVVLNGINPERLKAAEAAMAADYPPGRVHSCAFDVTKDTEAARGVVWVEENVGPLEILVNNAGIQHRVPMLDLEVSDWERVISTDLTSAFLVGREAARHMIPRGRGKIINICSVQTDLARPTIAPYIAAKGGLRNLTRAMTAEWAASGLQINGIAPGYIHTEMTQNLVDDEAVQLLDPGPHAGPPLGDRAGSGRPGGVAGLGRLQLRQRPDHLHRRRNDGGGLMSGVHELPATSAAVVAHAAGDLRIEEVPVSVPGPDEAVVEIAYGGICGSDLHYWLHGAAGESILKAPLVLGHEIVGTVLQAAADGTGPAAGTPVAVHPATPGPGAARYPEDRPNLSPGCTYLGSAARFPHTDGAFSRYANLPARMLRPLPEGLTCGQRPWPSPQPWPGMRWPAPVTLRGRRPW